MMSLLENNMISDSFLFVVVCFYLSLLIQVGIIFGQYFCCIDPVLLGSEMHRSQSTLQHTKYIVVLVSLCVTT